MVDDDLEVPTEADKWAAAAVLTDPDYLEGDDAATVDDPVTEEIE